MSKKDSGLQMSNVRSELPENMTPSLIPGFVPFGAFEDILAQVQSGQFFTAMIWGETSNGKTTLCRQAAAVAKRELIVVQITEETKEADLLGDFRLIDGNMAFYKGPVLEAYERGAILVLDEMPQGQGTKLMCLQAVLCGEPVLVKKTGKLYDPAPGFAVIATGNSRGEGDESSSRRYGGENVLNEAFLERFEMFLKQDYPPADVEEKILVEHCKDVTFNKHLVRWAGSSRVAFKNNTISNQITTRRLIHICRNFSRSGDRLKSIKFALGRFDLTTSRSLISTYCTIDNTVDMKAALA